MPHRSRSRTRPSRSRRQEAFIALLLGFLLSFAGCEAPGAAPAPSAATSSSAPLSSSPASRADTSAAPSASASAPAPSAQPTSVPDAVSAKAQPFLWEVKKGEATSYLFGTMHLGMDAEKELHPIVFQRLDAARAVFFEANVFDLDPMAVAAAAMLPPGQSVKSKLSPGRWQLLVDRVGGLLTPESTLERMKPWVLAAMLAQEMLPRTDPMDKVLYERAKAANKQLLFLETVEEQLATVERSMDVKVLDDMLGDLALVERLTKELAVAYQKGDLPGLLKVTFDPVEMKKHPALFDKLLFERNRNWLPKMIPELDKGGAFVAVGAAHLLGDKSVVALLEAKGFSLNRVPVR